MASLYWIDGLPYEDSGNEGAWLDGLQFAPGEGGIITLEPSSIASTATVGNPTVVWDADVTVSSIASTLAFGTATVANAVATILPSSIASTVAFGTAVVAVGTATISPSAIASTLSFGALALVGPSTFETILPASIASTATVGTPSAIPISSTRAFTVLLDGADITGYIRKPSFSISSQIDSKAKANFSIRPERSGVTTLAEISVSLFGDVVIYHTTPAGAVYRLFGGQVESVKKEIRSGTYGYYELDVTCTDYGVLLERRAIGETFAASEFGDLASILEHVVSGPLDGLGITLDPNVPDAEVEDLVANWETCGEFLRKLADATNTSFVVDPFKVLHFFDRTAGIGDAPFSIETDDGNWRSLESSETRSGYFNRVILRPDKDPKPIKSDSFTGDGSTSEFSTSYPMKLLAARGQQVTLNDTTTADYSRTGRQLAFDSAPGSGDAVNLSYLSDISTVVTAEDAVAIAEHGVYEHVEEVKDLSDMDLLQDYADALLERGLSALEIDIQLITDRPGLQPGQLLAIDANGIDDSFVIDQISIREYGSAYPQWTVTMGKGGAKNLAAGTSFFEKLKRQGRQAKDRISDGVKFHVAETIPGFSNPGVQVDSDQRAYATAMKSGVVAGASLSFETEEHAVIDVLHNGVSITGGTGISSEQPVTLTFTQNPMVIAAGDRFTLDVLEGNADAKDGFLMIEIAG
jgi:hypothetical protein